MNDKATFHKASSIEMLPLKALLRKLLSNAVDPFIEGIWNVVTQNRLEGLVILRAGSAGKRGRA
jgi:hypothetical protein